MEPLFDNSATAEDDKYNFLCNDAGAISSRNYTESLWAKYHPYAGLNFREQIRRWFYERFWEMYLACTLMDKGYELIGKTAFLPTKFKACLKLQNVSGYYG